jgi:sortase A
VKHKDAVQMKVLRTIERLLLVLGLVSVAIYIAALVHRSVLSRAELKRFHDIQARQAGGPLSQFPPAAQFKLDSTLWSPERIAAYEQSLEERLDPPMAVLRIAKVHLEVPVLEGTDDLVLNRAVGHINGTVRPGEDGNIGIAGHRDGFFRVLKDVVLGDTLELLTPRRTNTYVVDEIVLTRPDDVSVLQPRLHPSVTLVTCYPFYYIGSAPQRYIIHASELTSASSSPQLVSEQVSDRSHTKGSGDGLALK